MPRNGAFGPRSRPNHFGSGTGEPARPPPQVLFTNHKISMATAPASVTTARLTPRTRTAEAAVTRPMTTATAMPASAATGNVMPKLTAMCEIVNPAAPASASWTTEIWPTKAGRKAGLLSGGEQQMLALALVLSRRPKLLMLDEMSLGLAPVIVDRLLPVVREFATSHGAGVLLVEQHVHLALKIADRGYILTHGELAASGPAGQLSQDRALLAASYLGGAAG